ncbi:hypothetical protein QYE76_016444 [Lolium multiflorum]|uniref:Uncharacterized protein n=1 Tax=Lolium multiflorum TaxID=4521 RepID=A0AAD8PIR2_LOLMU|nr:hypothetical protein QYE76_016444 [Lolium multiflorum]
MGNALGCAGLGERLAAAARDGDAAEARRLLASDPGLARCTATFGNLSSPLHLAASKGHHEIAALLLENRSRRERENIYGQVWKADSLSGGRRYAAAAGGHVRCVRLLLADAGGGAAGDRVRDDRLTVARAIPEYVNRAASGGVTALHLLRRCTGTLTACLLIDEHAALGAQTLPIAAAPMAAIGAGARRCTTRPPAVGSSAARSSSGGHVLSPKSHLTVPSSLPPTSPHCRPLLAIAADHATNSPSFILQATRTTATRTPAPNAERSCNVAAEVCGHELCLKCAMDLCTVMAYEVPGLAGTIRARSAGRHRPPSEGRRGLQHPTTTTSWTSPSHARAPLQNCRWRRPGSGEEPSSSCRYSTGRQGYIGGDSVDSEPALALYCAPFAAPT